MAINKLIEEIKKTATTKEKFERMETLLSTLPESILQQIERAEFGGVGLNCYIKKTYGGREIPKVVIPNYSNQISHFGEYIGIYAGDFFFKIEHPEGKPVVVDYMLVEVEKP